VAIIDEERGGEGAAERNSRIQVFLSSIFSSLGGVFGSSFQDSNLTMASRAIAPIQHRGLFFFSFLHLGFSLFLKLNLRVFSSFLLSIRVHEIFYLTKFGTLCDYLISVLMGIFLLHIFY
jgi:hypothetical protein